MLFHPRWLIYLIFFEFLVSPLEIGADTRPSGLTLKATSQLVIVDVVVRDANGRPVTGLNKDDFKVFENGKRQTISAFEAHTGEAPQAIEQPPLPAHTFSNLPRANVPGALTVVLLDALNTPIADQSYVHEQVFKYLKSIRTSEPIAIFILSTRLRMVHGFTGDLPALLAALNDKNSRSLPQSSPLLRSGAEIHAEEQAIGQMQELATEFPDLQGAVNALRQFQAESAAGQTDDRVKVTLSELRQLARYLSAFPGRKNVVWFSGAFPLILFRGPSGMNAMGQARQDQILADGMSPQRQYQIQVRTTGDVLTRARVAIYPVDAKGLETDSFFEASALPAAVTGAQSATQAEISTIREDSVQLNANHATMDELASDTGGEAFYNTNGLNEALAQAIRDGSRYYTLAYVPPSENKDGKYRRIRVKLAHGHYQLAYRRGYNPDEEPTPGTAAERLAAGDPLRPLMASGLPDFSQILYLMSVRPAAPQPKPTVPRAGDNPKLEGPFTRMDVNLAISETKLQWEKKADGMREGTLEVSLIAYDKYGNPMNWLVKNIELSLTPERYKAYQDVGLQFHFELDAPRGAAYLRSGVCDLASGKAGTMEIMLDAAPAETSQESKSN